MKHWRWLLAVVMVVVVVAGGWRTLSARRTEQAAAASAATQRAQPLVELAVTDVVRAEQRELQRGLPVSGSLKAVNSAFLKARIAGELQGLSLREGDPVEAGQVVARVDPADAQARLKQAQEQADAARAQIEIAERQYNNNKALVDQGFISRTALDTSWNNLAAAQANHKATLAAVDMARKSLDDTVLRAPISGVVAQRLAQPGERVAVDTRVIEIVDLSRLEVEATLSAADSMVVRVGQEATLQVEGSARPVLARVMRINPSAHAGSRSVLAYLSLSDTAGLRQGLFAQGTLAIGRTVALAVPLSAVRTDKPTPYLQVVEGDKAVHKAVEPGARGEADRETWVAVEGVQAGAVVIRGHVGPLQEGTAVKFTAVPGAPPPLPSPRGGGSKAPSLRSSAPSP
jgi:RND family efflux transporter MFP subunit